MYTLEKWIENDHSVTGEWTTVGEYHTMEQAQPIAEDYRDRGELVRLTREGTVVVAGY